METTFARLIEHLAPRWLARVGQGLLGGCLGLGLAMGAGASVGGGEGLGAVPLVLPELVGLSLSSKPSGVEATKAPLNLVTPTPDPALRARTESPVQSAEPPLQRFSAGGHALGFAADRAIFANGRHALQIEFINANPVSPRSDQPTGSGQENKAPPLTEVRYPNLWNGIDLSYRAATNAIAESLYRLQPGADIAQVRLRYNRPLALNGNGSLGIRYGTGTLSESAPKAWQEVAGQQQPVAVAFVLHSEKELGFTLGDYDPTRPLWIDPRLSWVTFLGGGGVSWDCNSLALDTHGNLYVMGYSDASWGNPVRAYTSPPPADSYDSYDNYDVFVAKLNGSGDLIWNTFLGGGGTILTFGGSTLGLGGDDRGFGIAVDSHGNVYVAGASSYTWGNPLHDHSFSTDSDAFVAKLDSSGTLLWNTFLGGSGNRNDYARDIAVDGSGNVYITGEWDDVDTTYQHHWGAFAAKLNADGAVLWNNFLSELDIGSKIALDSDDNAYVLITPSVGSSDNSSCTLDKLNGSTGALLWNISFAGGYNEIYGMDMAVDNSGDVYVTGRSNITWGDPVQAHSGSYDYFVAKFKGDNGALIWNTFLGGYGGGFSHIAVGDAMIYVGISHVLKLNRDNGISLWNPPFYLDGIIDPANGEPMISYGIRDITVDLKGDVYVGSVHASSSVGPGSAFIAKITEDSVLELLDLACNNSQGPCTGDYLTTNQNGTIVPDSSPERLRELQIERNGVVADGVTKLLLRLKTDSDRPVTFQILPPDGVPAAEASPCRWGTLRDRHWTQSSCQAITLSPDQLSSGDYYAFAVYEAPLDNPTDTKSQIRLQAVVDGGDPTIRSLGIEPPPVMLVHGVWSSPAAWRVIAGFLRQSGFNQGLGADLELVNHSDIEHSAGSFDPYQRSFVIGRLRSAIRQVQDDLRSRGIAVTQVDVVAHSMGGLITRALEKSSWSGSQYPYKRRGNYMAGDVHKLIAVGTPHQGTKIADTLIENKCNKFSLSMTLEEVLQRAGQPLGQAVYGFQTGSLPIRHIGNSTIPSHAIVGLAPATSDTEENLNLLMRGFHVLATVDNLLGGDMEHDTIVPRISQRGGMDANRRTEVSGVVHADVEIPNPLTSPDDVNETNSLEIFDKMVGLLREPVQGGKFGGFSALPAGGVYREPYTCPASLSQSTAASTQADIAFAPTPGTTVTPGQIVSISLSVTGGNATDAAMFIVDGRWRFLQGPGPYAMDYQVPGEKAGRIPIIGITFGPGPDNYMMETHILVQPGEPLTSLDASPAHLALDAGSIYSILVSGRFANGARIDLTSSTAGTSYATLSGTTNILSVSPDGIVEARAAGKETILISYANLSTSVLVTVEEALLVPGPAMPVITSGPSGTTNASSASFTFSGEAGVGFECALDDGSYEACASPFQVQVSSGTHIFSVRAINADGLVSDPAVRQWNSVTTTFTGGEGEGSAEIDTSNGTTCGFDPTQTGFAAATNPPANLSFPHGLFHFRLVGCDPGSTVTLKVRWPGQAGGQYWKFNPRTSQWYPYPGAFFNPLNSTWTFQITDNGPHDADPTPGSILDPAGPARVSGPGGGSGQSANPIPTLSPWMLLALVGLLGVLVLGVHRARRTLGS